jgi:hypothetical protein
MKLDSKVWGPHYWFFLHTIAITYPLHPNTMTKKKYYEFIHNIPLFIPIDSMSTYFSKLLDEYPVTPYLDTRDSFIRWMHFIHNKINERLEKPKISLEDFYKEYYEAYKPKQEQLSHWVKKRGKIVYFFLLFSLFGLIYYFYKK